MSVLGLSLGMKHSQGKRGNRSPWVGPTANMMKEGYAYTGIESLRLQLWIFTFLLLGQSCGDITYTKNVNWIMYCT